MCVCLLGQATCWYTCMCILSMLPAGPSQGNREGDGDEEDGEVHRRGKERIFERGEHHSGLPPSGD